MIVGLLFLLYSKGEFSDIILNAATIMETSSPGAQNVKFSVCAFKKKYTEWLRRLYVKQIIIFSNHFHGEDV